MEHSETVTLVVFSGGTFLIVISIGLSVVVVCLRSMTKGLKLENSQLKAKVDELIAKITDFVASKKVEKLNPRFGALFREMRQSFVLEEVKEICFNLGIDPESFEGKRDPMARELIVYCSENSQLDDLMAELRLQRPDVEWPKL